MKLRRIMFAAPKSGSGKTIITCALLQALKNKGQQVIAYKCGPDYIDPMFHEQVIGVPSKNLDTFFTDEIVTKDIFLKERTESDFAILEGVMGIFDGLGGVREEGSSYHLAKVTKTPIILVIDAKGMGRSILPLIAGFLAYDTQQLIRGVILNRMSKGYYEIIKPLIEEELNIQVVGYFPEQKEVRIESRHLGLMMPGEIADIKEQLSFLAEMITKTISAEQIVEIAESAEELDIKTADVLETKKVEAEQGPVIAVAKDEAFCFYYTDNLKMLEEMGAKLQYFSPLHDETLPEKCHALLLGGGYPELYAESLSKNISMRNAVSEAIKEGMPVVAECGGFMYLHSAITDKDGKTYKMTDVVKGTCSYKGKLVRFGYIEVEEKVNHFLKKGGKIRGHEFHYFDSTANGEDCIASKPVSGKTYLCIIAEENKWMGFPHLYYPSNPEFAKVFVEKARKYKLKSENGNRII